MVKFLGRLDGITDKIALEIAEYELFLNTHSVFGFEKEITL